MATKWECEKCLFDNEASISFCQLCGHHASVPLLRMHVEAKQAELDELERPRDGYTPDVKEIQAVAGLRDQLKGIITRAELAEERQRQREAEDTLKQKEDDDRPWPSLAETFEDLMESVSAEMDGDLPTFTYSWSANATSSSSADATAGAAGGDGGESKASRLGGSKLRPTSPASAAAAAKLSSLLMPDGAAAASAAAALDEPEGTFPDMSHATVVKRITSYSDKAAIRMMLKYYDDRTIAHCIGEHGDPGGQYWALDGVDPDRKKRCMLPPFGWSKKDKRDQAMALPVMERWAALMECGEQYMTIANAEDAESVLEAALFVAEATWPATHRCVGQTCNSLGWLRMRQADFEAAVTLFKRAYEVYFRLEYPTPDAREHLGNHPMCSSIIQTIARIKALIANRDERRADSGRAGK